MHKMQLRLSVKLQQAKQRIQILEIFNKGLEMALDELGRKYRELRSENDELKKRLAI